MSIVLVQDYNDKFINNLKLVDNNGGKLVVYGANINSNLYKIYHQYKFDSAIFIESLITPEILQFISEFFQKIKFSIYHNRTPNQDIIKDYKIAAKQLVNVKNIKDTIIIPNLINSQLYSINPKVLKNNDIICFIDNIASIPLQMMEFLYPSKSMNIKMFNNTSIEHVQNIGLLNEIDKSILLNMSKYYISIDNYYAKEAQCCGCEVLDISELDTLKVKKYAHIEEYQTYQDFLENHIL